MTRKYPVETLTRNPEPSLESTFPAYFRFPAFPLHGHESDYHDEYSQWLRTHFDLNLFRALSVRESIANLTNPVEFHIIIFSSPDSNQDMESSLDSLSRQDYPFFSTEICCPDLFSIQNSRFDQFSRNHSIAHSFTTIDQLNSNIQSQHTEKWILFLYPGDVLPSYTLTLVAYELSKKQQYSILYHDDDQTDSHGRFYNPRFKPDWSLTHFRSTDFIGNSVFLSAKAIIGAGGIHPYRPEFRIHDLILRILDASGSDGIDTIGHLPGILLHCRPMCGLAAPEHLELHKAALLNHFARAGLSPELSSPVPGIFKVRYILPQPKPSVSVIIPTRDSPELLRTCIESLVSLTLFEHLEILVVDNQSKDPAALKYLNSLPLRNDHDWQFRVIHYNNSFNFSAINNFAAKQARGELLCLLNNDTEIISPDWLEEMVGHLLQPGVGVVGAKLFYPDGRIQHAGDVIGRGGCANHLHAFLDHNDPGYCNRAIVAQELSAVTAACMLTTRSLYLSLGGLDQKHLKVAFNDVDYCLRVRKAGYKIIWTPYAELIHHESVSRGRNRSLSDWVRARFESFIMRRRWKAEMMNDPFYNPLLCRKRPDFSLCDERALPQNVQSPGR